MDLPLITLLELNFQFNILTLIHRGITMWLAMVWMIKLILIVKT